METHSFAAVHDLDVGRLCRVELEGGGCSIFRPNGSESQAVGGCFVWAAGAGKGLATKADVSFRFTASDRARYLLNGVVAQQRFPKAGDAAGLAHVALSEAAIGF